MIYVCPLAVTITATPDRIFWDITTGPYIKREQKTVLWGSSVEPELLKQEKISADIASYDLIVARETISYEALKNVNPNTILAPDPAFFLDRMELPLPEGFSLNNTVGINVSPLIMKNEQQEGITAQNYERLIDFILKETDMSIALIPHVIEAAMMIENRLQRCLKSSLQVGALS